MDYWLETGLWLFELMQRMAKMYGGGEIKRTGCSLKFLGECVAAALKMGETETRNRRIKVSEVYYTGQGLIEELERATDEKCEAEKKPLRDLKRKEDEEMERGNMDKAYFAFVVRNDFDNGPAGLLEDGFDCCRDGALKVHRRSLAKIIDEVVDKAITSTR